MLYFWNFHIQNLYFYKIKEFQDHQIFLDRIAEDNCYRTINAIPVVITGVKNDIYFSFILFLVYFIFSISFILKLPTKAIFIDSGFDTTIFGKSFVNSFQSINNFVYNFLNFLLPRTTQIYIFLIMLLLLHFL